MHVVGYLLGLVAGVWGAAVLYRYSPLLTLLLCLVGVVVAAAVRVREQAAKQDAQAGKSRWFPHD